MRKLWVSIRRKNWELVQKKNFEQTTIRMHSDLNETNATYYYASHWRRFPFCDFSNILFMSCAHLRFTSHLVRKCFENNKMKNSTICISVDAFRQMLGSSVTNQNGVLCVTEFRKICIQFKNVNNNAKLISITETDFRHSYFFGAHA